MNLHRRAVLAIVLAVSSTPRIALSQQGRKTWRIGYLNPGSRDGGVAIVAFKQRLRELGYVEGRDYLVDLQSADGKYDALPALAARLVQSKVDVIVAPGAPAIRAARGATTTIPIVMAGTGDPVGAGFVASLSKPGGNTTGVSNVNFGLVAKQLELMMRTMPKLARIALLYNPANGSTVESQVKSAEAAAHGAKVELRLIGARTAREIEEGFDAMARDKVGAVIIGADPFFASQSELIGRMTLKHRLPASCNSLAMETGVLIVYAAVGTFGNAAEYVDKILKGAKPADLAIEEPTRFNLTVNTRIARSLGIVVPQEILVLADKVIE